MDISSPQPTVVTINGCTIRGATQAPSRDYPVAVDSFYGIPFAETERFRRTRQHNPGPTTTINAQKPGPSQPYSFAPGETRENPLTLNIFRPHPTLTGTVESGSGSGLPVVVYVHGGAFNFSDPLERDVPSFVSWAAYEGHKLIMVSVSYRLGALGFLAHSHRGQGAGGIAGDGGEANLGLRDQRAAVEWVLRWVNEFGGNAENVTLMGVSAGAHSIGHHMLHPSPLPFRKAILESGSPTARSVLSLHHPRTISQHQSLQELTGGKSLTSLTVDELLEAAIHVWAINAASVCWPFQPVVDGPGGMIPDTPLAMWQQATQTGRVGKQTAVLTGFSSDEGVSMVPGQASTNAEFRSFFARLVPGLTAADLDALEALYPDPVTYPSTSLYTQEPASSRRGAQFRRLAQAYAHYGYICPVLHTAHTMSRVGASVYVYEYAATSAAFGAASHGDHAPVVNHEASVLRNRPGLAAVSREMNRRWAAFAVSKDGSLADGLWPRFTSPFGNYDGRGDVVEEMPAVDGAAGQILVFGDGNSEAGGGSQRGVPVRTRTLTTREREVCRFWWARMHLSQGMGGIDTATP